VGKTKTAGKKIQGRKCQPGDGQRGREQGISEVTSGVFFSIQGEVEEGDGAFDLDGGKEVGLTQTITIKSLVRKVKTKKI